LTSEEHPTYGMTIPGHVEVRDGRLTIGGEDCDALAEEFGTPLYVTSADRVRENYRRITDAMEAAYSGEVRVHYACKANTNLSVLELLEDEGARIDAVSLGEVESALRAGFDPEDVLYTGTAVSREEMEGVVERGATVNVDFPGRPGEAGGRRGRGVLGPGQPGGRGRAPRSLHHRRPGLQVRRLGGRRRRGLQDGAGARPGAGRDPHAHRQRHP